MFQRSPADCWFQVEPEFCRGSIGHRPFPGAYESQPASVPLKVGSIHSFQWEGIQAKKEIYLPLKPIIRTYQ